MSKGSPVIPLRIPQTLLNEMEIVIAQRNTLTLNEPWSRSSFIVAAIREKLAHMERSRSKKKTSKSVIIAYEG